MIIALCGQIGVGKTHIAKQYLVPRGFIDIGFADQLKIQLIAEGRLTYEEAYHTKPEKMRRLCYERGTLEGWKTFGKDMWVKAVLAWVRRLRESMPDAKFVITDVRFAGEIEALSEMGVPLVLVRAPKRHAAATQGLFAEVVVQENALKNPDVAYFGVLDNDYEAADLNAQLDALLLRVQGGPFDKEEVKASIDSSQEGHTGQ